MPWRAPYINARRHPYAWALYAFIAAIGFSFISGWLPAAPYSQIPHVWQLVWEWEMAIGGLLGFAAIMRRKDLTSAVAQEGVAATACFFGMSTWIISAAQLIGYANVGVVLFLMVDVGYAGRIATCIRDYRLLSRLADRYEQLHRGQGDG